VGKDFESFRGWYIQKLYEVLRRVYNEKYDYLSIPKEIPQRNLYGYS
jgi:hypothetical protein